jgi:hypothetical protein
MATYKSGIIYTGIDFRTLPDHTAFHVINGAWSGSIFSEKGQKYVHIDEINTDRLITDENCGDSLRVVFDSMPNDVLEPSEDNHDESNIHGYMSYDTIPY